MKFNSAWDSVEKENRFLKALCGFLLILSLALSVAVLGTASQAPLIVERGCSSRMLSPVADAPTNDEMKGFTEEALQARFNTKETNVELLSLKQRGYRVTEQEELEKQKMKQVVVVNDVTVEKDGLVVDADRLISVGEIRSTFKFPLKVRLERIRRTEDNPYGLLLSDVEEIKSEVKK